MKSLNLFVYYILVHEKNKTFLTSWKNYINQDIVNILRTNLKMNQYNIIIRIVIYLFN